VRELKATRDGFLVTLPKREDVGKLFREGEPDGQRLFAIGDPTKLVIKVPVSPQQYHVLVNDKPKGSELAATIYIKGRSDREFTGRVVNLPQQNAATVPIQLTQRGGGPLAVKPGEDPNVLIPLAQTYVIEVELTDPNATIKPGQLAVVKIHAKWRSAAWWVGQALANALDIGFY
jgi:putative peptide zinc metalloprotease protein